MIDDDSDSDLLSPSSDKWYNGQGAMLSRDHRRSFSVRVADFFMITQTFKLWKNFHPAHVLSGTTPFEERKFLKPGHSSSGYIPIVPVLVKQGLYQYIHSKSDLSNYIVDNCSVF